MSNYDLRLLNALYDLSEALDGNNQKLMTIKQVNKLNELMDKADKENLVW
jgi:hypothetical protein